MIFCHDKIYAHVWSVDKKEKYVDLRVSTSEKDMDNNYVDSTWFPRLIGHAFNTMRDSIKKGDDIIITKSKFTNEKYTDKDGNLKSSFKFVVFEAEYNPRNNKDGNGTGAAENTPAPERKPEPKPVVEEDDSPW